MSIMNIIPVFLDIGHFQFSFHVVSPLRKLGTLVPRGIGGFVKLNSLDFFTIDILSVDLSLLIMV